MNEIRVSSWSLTTFRNGFTRNFQLNIFSVGKKERRKEVLEKSLLFLCQLFLKASKMGKRREVCLTVTEFLLDPYCNFLKSLIFR